MKIIDTDIPDIKLLEPRVFEDERGFFFESYNRRSFEALIGGAVNFLQDNHSKSSRGVVRGLHYQLPPRGQGKLVRVVNGSVFDVAVDIRCNSPTFGYWVGEILSAENRRQMWIPEGFAHGFVALSESAEFLYKTTDYYAPEFERCILWADPDIAIDWPTGHETIASAKDRNGALLRQAECFA